MGLRSYLRGDRYLQGAYDAAGDEQRALPRPENELPLYAPYTSSSMTPLQALGICDAWACIQLLASTASSLPIHVYRERPDGGRERVRAGKLVDLLTHPSAGNSQADLIGTAMIHMLGWGACYLGKYRDDAGAVSQLVALHPDRIRPELQGGELRFRYTPGGAGQRMLTSRDVTYVKALSADGLYGLSPVAQCASVLNLSSELVAHALGYFSTQVPKPSGILKLDPESTSEQQERLYEKLRVDAKHHGILLVRGDADFVDIAGTLDNAQFMEQRQLVSREVARAFGVPGHLVGAPSSDSKTYATIEMEATEYLRFSLMPHLRRLELGLSADPDLASLAQYCKFETDALLRGDTASRTAYYSAGLDPVSGWLDVDEVRAWEDLPPRGAPTPAQVMTQAVQAAMTNGGSNGTS